jgi:2-polyprenyl-6-methoxyphenol hydroxylase-like FAD-dependent oxidoreductase
MVPIGRLEISRMQFHLNGFRTGNPAISEPVSGHQARADRPASEVDVLIVGCGPAGLTLAAQLAVFPDIRVAIVEQKAGPLQLGQADGIACRSVETYEALGFSERILKESYWVNETTFWKPDDAKRENIVRSGRIQDVEDGLSEFPHVILNQARVHDFLLESMRNGPTRLEPYYSRRLADLTIDVAGANDADAYPVTATLERIDFGHEGEMETVKARYVVGTDGARSAVRQSIGRTLTGDSANHAWGVMDVLAVTTFPDIRFKSAIYSATEGNLMIIPREGGYLVRLYIEIDKLQQNERVAEKHITVDRLIAAAQGIFKPYSFDVKEVAWWSVYEIGQRLTDKFDDVPAADVSTRQPRVFIAGDACHTHSPKAGQGMNVSIADAFNLGWKLAAVLRGTSTPQLLATYSEERQAYAQELIDFDRAFSKLISTPPKDPAHPEAGGIEPEEFQRAFVEAGRFTAGLMAHYRPSLITGEPTFQHLAEGFEIGTRFHSAPVTRYWDAKRVQLAHTIKADGRWRLFLFAGAADPGSPQSRLEQLCAFLAESADSPIRQFTPADADIDAVIDVRAILQRDHRELSPESIPPLLVPQKGRYGLRDYEKVFCTDLAGEDDIFIQRKIDRANGCIVIVRPDQFVASVLPLDAVAELSAFFNRVMVAPTLATATA